MEPSDPRSQTQPPPAHPLPTGDRWSPAREAPTTQQAGSSEFIAKIIYVLYLASLLLGVTALVAVVMAYVYAPSAPDALRTHYRFLIRTFWIGILYSAIGLVLSFLVIGFGVLLFVVVWLIIRCVKGLKLLGERRPVPDPATWLW